MTLAPVALVALVVAVTALLALPLFWLTRNPRAAAPSGDAAPPERPVRVVIIGGGFGGVHVAAELERLAGDRDDLEICLFSDENYFVFQPMLPEVISGQLQPLDVVSPLRRLLARTRVHVRAVESVDLAARTVTAAAGMGGHPHVVHYDHVILAPGTVTDFRGLTGLPEHALPFKNLADALRLRNHVIHALEEADVEDDDEDLRRALLTFVVAGGGFSGVEVCAELNDFVREVARHYPRIDPSEIRVLLVHSQERILPEMSARLAAYAQRILQQRGVELVLGQRLKAATGEHAVLADGTRIPTRTLVSTVPSSPHPLVERLALPKSRAGRLLVDGTLRVRGHEAVWALGDCAEVPTLDGKSSPPTAQHPVRQARTCARNVFAALRGEAPAPFDFRGLGKMGSLGRRNAVAEIFGVQLSGALAWFLWRTIYLMKLPGWGRRAKVAASWTFDLVLPPELVQLRLESIGGARTEHFEAGEHVFEMGDVGDRVYVILRGAAEVVRDGVVLARLGPSDVFGEMAVLGQTTRNATVRCTEATDAMSIPRREVALLTASLPDVRRRFEELASSCQAA
jgi:NADH dehydrogenase